MISIEVRTVPGPAMKSHKKVHEYLSLPFPVFSASVNVP